MTRNLILYIANLVGELEGSLGVTRLVKLLYLIDVEFYRRYRRKLTDLNWIFYKYGPYSFEIEQHLRSLDLYLMEEDVALAGGRTFRKLQSVAGDIGIDVIGGRSAQIVVERVVRLWSLEDLNALLSYVYFETEPMSNPVLGEPLNFGAIEPRRLESTLDRARLQLTEDEANTLRTRLNQFRIRREAEQAASHRQRETIHQTPDPAYDEARRMMREDEAAILPETDVHLEGDQA